MKASTASHWTVTETATGQQDYVLGVEHLKFADTTMLIVS